MSCLGTNDDVTIEICSDIDKKQCCTTPGNNSINLQLYKYSQTSAYGHLWIMDNLSVTTTC